MRSGVYSEKRRKQTIREEKWTCEVGAGACDCQSAQEVQADGRDSFPGSGQVVCDKMRECDFGLFEGKNYQELTGNPKYQSWIDSGGTKAFPGGEDPMEFRKRCVCGFEEMMEKMIKGKRKKIAFVVHGGTIMSVMEAFDPEKKEFYHWQVKNGKGFHFQIEEEKWQQGNRQFEEIEEI